VTDPFDFIGKAVRVTIDRPMGSRHPEHGFVYPVNYGYIEGTKSPDGEELDAYALGTFNPLDRFEGECIAVIRRLDDDDDKLVVTPAGRRLSAEQIRVLTEFQERFFQPTVHFARPAPAGNVGRVTKDDFDQILTDLKAFWGEENDTIWVQHSPILLHEFGDTAFVIREGNRVAAYLFGFISQTEPIGYIHLIAVRDGHRRKGHATILYDHFEKVARGRGCEGLKAVAMPWNDPSVAFHRSAGFEPVGVPDAEGKCVVRNYRGPGKDRVVLQKRWV
jgi:inorganic pyrophosphatase